MSFHQQDNLEQNQQIQLQQQQQFQQSQSPQQVLQPQHQYLSQDQLQDSYRKEKQKVVSLHGELEDLKSKFQMSQQQNHMLQQDIDVLQQRLSIQHSFRSDEQSGRSQRFSQPTSSQKPAQQLQSQSQSKLGQSELEQQQQQQQFEQNFQEELAEKEALISRLNAKVSQTKIKEQGLLEENAKLEQMYNELQQEFFEFKSSQAGTAGKPNIFQDDSISVLGKQFKQSELEKSLGESINNERILSQKIEMMQHQMEQIQNENQKFSGMIIDFEKQERDYKGQLEDFNNQNYDLHEQIRKMKEDYNSINTQHEEIVLLQDKLDVKEKIAQKFEKEIIRIKMNHSEQVELQNEKISQLMNYNEQYKQQIEELLQQVKDLQNKVSVKDDNQQFLVEEQQKGEIRLKELLEENTELKQQNRKYGVEIQDLSNKLMNISDKTQLELQKRDEFENKMAEKIDNYERSLILLEEENLKLKAEQVNLQDEVSRAEKHKRLLQSQVKDKEDLMTEEKEMFSTKEHLLTSQLEQLKNDVQQISTKYMKSPENALSISSSQKQLNPQVYDTNQTVQSYRPPQQKSKKRSKSSNKSLKNNNNFTSPQANRTALEFDSVQQEFDEIQQSQTEKNLRMEIQSLKLEIAQLTHKLDRQASRNKELQSQNQDQEDLLQQGTVRFEDQKSICDTLKRENELMRQQSQKIESYDTQLLRELNELREVKEVLMHERERILVDLEIKEEQRQGGELLTKDLTNFVRSLESKCINYQSDLTHKIQECDAIQREKNAQIQVLEQDKQEFMDLLQIKDEQLENLQRDKKQIEYEMQDSIAKNQDVEVKLQNTEKHFTVELNAQIQRNNEQKEQIEQVNVQAALLREEIVENNRKSKETLEISRAHIKLLQENFVQNLNEVRKLVVKGKIKDIGQYNKFLEQISDSISKNAHKDANIKSLKDKSGKQEKTIKNNKNTISQQDTAIQQLKAELIQCYKQMSSYKVQKSTKKVEEVVQKTGKQNQQDPSQIVKQVETSALEAKVINQKANNKMLQEEISFLRDENQILHEQVDNLQREIEEQESERQNILKENINQKNIQKQLETKITSQKQNIQNQTMQQATLMTQGQIQNLEQKIKEQKDDLLRKKDLIQQMKTVKDEREYEVNQLKTEIGTIKEDNERLKKFKTDSQRKDAIIKDLKEKHENLKNTTKKADDLNSTTTEKVRQLRNDLTRKEIIIKELKDKQSELNESFIKRESVEEDKLREVVKKLRTEINNKEIVIKNVKNKLENKAQELERLKTENINKTADTIVEQDREQKKIDTLRLTLKKLSSQQEMLVFLLKRIFRENFVSYQKESQVVQQKNFNKTQKKQKGQPYPQDIQGNKFMESLNILNLDPEDIGQFLDPNQYTDKQQQYQSSATAQRIPQISTVIVDKFEAELDSKEQVNVNNVYNMIQSLIEDRINLQNC